MRHEFRVAGDKIGSQPCITLGQGGERELCLAGPLGEIWLDSEPHSTFKAFRLTVGGNEKIESFNIKDLEKWVIKLKVPLSPEDQLYWANNPNKRFIGRQK